MALDLQVSSDVLIAFPSFVATRAPRMFLTVFVRRHSVLVLGWSSWRSGPPAGHQTKENKVWKKIGTGILSKHVKKTNILV